MISSAERKERQELVGFCDRCQHYTEFNKENDKELCELCSGKFSTKVGFQITTKRTFIPKMKGAKK